MREDPHAGASILEHYFRHPLQAHPGIVLEPFDFVAIGAAHGRAAMSRMLAEHVSRTRPDLLFMTLLDDERDPLREAVREITEGTGTATLLWVSDDHWQLRGHSSRWAPCVDWLVTTDPDALPAYEALGLSSKVVLSQWAIDHTLYVPAGGGPELGVSFVGQAYPDRVAAVAELRRRGLEVATFGRGWSAGGGHLPFAEMLRVFSRSRVNLNFTAPLVPSRAQIKGRNFEVPACGGFLLTQAAPYLDEFFELGSEVVVFAGLDELAERIRWFLAHDAERRAIAARGQRRCLADHTWERRFGTLFRQTGLFEGTAKGRCVAGR
jgi:hypothetical protein